MKTTLNFTKGSLNGFFVIHLKNGNEIYAENLFKFDSEKAIRCSTYLLKINGKSVDSMGEHRIEVGEIEEIEIKGNKY